MGRGRVRSFLEIYDLATRSREIILSSERLIEAPNWHPDGKTLLVNGEGRLYRVPLSAPALVPLDTGDCVACNNDHGISPDGARVMVSSKLGGSSTVFSVPWAGGQPVQITAKNPSYWHGWAPDGRRFAFVGQRGASDGSGAFDIYTMPVAGGAELRLTEEMGHCDGPDYTRDGRWIWFNSDVSGAAQIWRMRLDGSDKQMMTNDNSVNWFPHPSPVSDSMLYLAYPEGTLQHPRDRDVSLRLLRDGAMEELCRFNGGQGSINVPCWAPDGRRFAFMSYGAPG